MTTHENYAVIREHHPALVDTVEHLVSHRAEYGPQVVSKLANRAIRNDGAQLVLDRRRQMRLVDQWEAEASAPTGMDNAQHMAEHLRSEADQAWDAGLQQFAEGVRAAQTSRRILLEPDTCKLVVDMDLEGRLSQYMGVDVSETFGLRRTGDQGVTFEQLKQVPANAKVDFSLPVAAAEPVQRVRIDTLERQRSEPTPIRKALLEEIAAMRARQGHAPGSLPELG